MPIEAKAMELTMFHSMLHLVESAVIPSMQKQKSGYIANILSRARLGGGVSGLAYTAAKHKIEVLRGTHAPVRVPEAHKRTRVLNVQYELDDKADVGETDSLMASGPISPEEVANVLVLLGSDISSAVNGAVIPVDKGWSAAWLRRF
ncbi:hypothetical protein PSV09DRAFT_2254628 [Bipolaris maydis]|uniref:uncharacterized protein n=1 Tax=Cochliobolus heterostrophus TaxID=5016 RepID=UPI0024DA835A|nr:hypothetical protein J3E74DRAFT_285836 [Bipolaris maydis]KAJ6213576.1 hypothetical protein PSV09DRAFT_2254628 [Bipolaris maydis]KAJ6274798.1 hypothetical protein PSV08DRAFT_243852 [Bipolaris maydis]KAJ6285920.1 hypothetical protein J3E71DRAFT_236804 [Bipolaris maydis]